VELVEGGLDFTQEEVGIGLAVLDGGALHDGLELTPRAPEVRAASVAPSRFFGQSFVEAAGE
jgi:hypothetical protein